MSHLGADGRVVLLSSNPEQLQEYRGVPVQLRLGHAQLPAHQIPAVQTVQLQEETDPVRQRRIRTGLQ